MRLNFSYDIDKEFINLQAGNRSLNRIADSDFSDKLVGLGVDISSQESVSNGCRDVIAESGIDPDKQARIFAEKWHSIEQEASTRFDKLFETNGESFSMAAYLSLNERCSYNVVEGYFFLHMFSKDPLTVCLHEIFHLYTHKLIKLDVDSQTYNAYKESLTALLNTEFDDLIEHEDRGYPQHQRLRKYISSKHDKSSSIVELTKVLFVDDAFLALLKDIV